jgi:alpha-L-arabinofuranosidase
MTIRILQRLSATVLMGLTALVAFSAPVAQTAQLVNGGFEDTNVLSSWRIWVYKEGTDPIVRGDTSQAHEGASSLLVEATEPSDVALGQLVTLPPASVWRVRCWVKTEGLMARDRTDIGGSVHVQTPDGATLARGPSTFGSTAWHEVAVPFRVPGDGQVKIVLFYIGYGKGTGKAWFDDVRLDQVRAAGVSEVRITTKRLSRLPVDAKQGGQFIEPLCNLIPSLIAQQVANTSFEIEPPWTVAFRREVDKPYRPWYPDGAVHLARYSFDTNHPGNGQRSLRIELPTLGARAGIAQDGFYFRQKQSYRLRLQARSEGGVTVRATFRGGGSVVARAGLGRAAKDWTRLETSLRADRTVENGTLSLEFEGAGTLWLDRVSLIDEDAVLGLWRRDAVEALRGLKPGILRFGGSALESYEWDQSLGPPGARAPFPLGAWGGLDENFVGVEEFVVLCREVEAEPLVCVRWTGKTPQDAAAEVEYFNGDAETKWGKLRVRNGHAKPWGVKFWQVGNEVGGADYERTVEAFARAMRRTDLSIRVLSSLPSPAILEAGGGQLDYLCPHHYGCADLAGMESDFLTLEEQIRRSASPRPVRIAVTEWNTTAGDWELRRATLQTLQNALACSRYHNLMQRHADSVEIAIRSNLIDSFCSGVIQTGPGWIYLAPTYYAQQLYTRAAGSYPLRVHRPGDEASETVLPWHLDEPDLSAVLNGDGRTLRVYGVNSTAKPISVKTSLEGLGLRAGRTWVCVLRDSERGPTPEILNTRDEPNRVRVFQKSVRMGSHAAELAFEPFSLTLYEIPVTVADTNRARRAVTE